MTPDRDAACYRDAHFQFTALQRAFQESQTNPHWKDMSVN